MNFLRNLIARRALCMAFAQPIPPATCEVRGDIVVGVQRAATHLQCGIHVLLAPASAQTRASVQGALRDLRFAGRIAGALHVSPQARKGAFLTGAHLNRALPLSVFAQDNHRARPYVVFFENFPYCPANSEVENWLADLAEKSALEKKFCVIVHVASEAQYNALLKIKGGEKIRAVSPHPPSLEEMSAKAKLVGDRLVNKAI